MKQVYLNREYKITMYKEIGLDKPLISTMTLEASCFRDLARKIEQALDPNEYVKSIELVSEGRTV